MRGRRPTLCTPAGGVDPERAGSDAGMDADVFVEGLDYSMLIVTVRVGDRREGCLIGFSTQTGIHPFRYLVCLSRANATTEAARTAEHLAVHRIGTDRPDLARLFGEHTGQDTDKFAACDWSDGPEGVPLLAGCPAWLVGRVESRLDLGDHEGFLLSAVAAGRAPGGCARDVPSLTFRALPPMDPGHPA
jgi:flavin reductase (DIM6/NTAB) family NADH-FMN oxidoreductase RutF